MAWNAANTACQDMVPGFEGELATVSDGDPTAYFLEHLNLFLSKLITTPGNSFIGAYKNAGTWTWSNMDPWGYHNWNSPSEPSGHASETIIMMSPNGKWNDASPNTPYATSFICQYSRTRLKI